MLWSHATRCWWKQANVGLSIKMLACWQMLVCWEMLACWQMLALVVNVRLLRNVGLLANVGLLRNVDLLANVGLPRVGLLTQWNSFPNFLFILQFSARSDQKGTIPESGRPSHGRTRTHFGSAVPPKFWIPAWPRCNWIGHFGMLARLYMYIAPPTVLAIFFLRTHGIGWLWVKLKFFILEGKWTSVDVLLKSKQHWLVSSRPSCRALYFSSKQNVQQWPGQKHPLGSF